MWRAEKQMTNNTTSNGLSHIGRIAKQNEDNYICDSQLGLYIVADGMGGHAAGEIASKLAIDNVVDSFNKEGSLTEAINIAHQSILNAMQQDQQLIGMGTTMVAAQINAENTYQIAWVGDSRCYHWGETFFEQITNDHSLLQALLASGKFSYEQASKHPESKSLTQAVGVSEQMSLQVTTTNGLLCRNEYLLLCSDGLTDELSNSDIQALFKPDDTPDQISEHLINAALRMGGRDNITVIVISAADNAPIRKHHDQHASSHSSQSGIRTSKLFNWLGLGMITLSSLFT